MSVTIAVTAHTSRLDAATELCEQLDARMFLDNGTLGEPGNTRAALRWLEQADTSHGLIVQDDALLAPGFLERVERALAQRPADIISYYIGTGRPAQGEVEAKVWRAERYAEDWIELRSLYWGVAWSAPTAILRELNAWLSSHEGPTDRTVGAWLIRKRQHCAHVWPCLVDHADGPTLIHHTRPHLERKAWKFAGYLS